MGVLKKIFLFVFHPILLSHANPLCQDNPASFQANSQVRGSAYESAHIPDITAFMNGNFKASHVFTVLPWGFEFESSTLCPVKGRIKYDNKSIVKVNASAGRFRYCLLAMQMIRVLCSTMLENTFMTEENLQMMFW